MIDERPVWRRDRSRRRNFEWSFGSAVAAIVVGTIIATGIVWFAAEVRARYELRQLELAIAAETRKIEAELQAQRKAEEDRQRARRNAQYQRDFQVQEAARKRRDVERREAERLAFAARRDQIEGRYFPPAVSSMAVDTWACMEGQVVRRTPDGWTVSVDGSGKPGKCRTTP